jgi:glucokinase
MAMHILAADVGGTNTRLLLAEVHANDWYILFENSYPSARYTGLVQLINTFLQESQVSTTIDAACIAVAGPVESGVASVTNLPWVISEQQLSDLILTPRVKLINDFVAVAHGISELSDADIQVLQQGVARENMLHKPDAAVLGAGTGLGVSHRVWMNDRYHVYPSEAGHTGFAPENIAQCELLAWMLKKHPHVSLELLLSGRGLATIYHYLLEVAEGAGSPAASEILRAADPAMVITRYGLSGDDELCIKTLEWFIDIYGAAAGNAALHYYPVGELYIAGGIAPRIKGQMLNKRFVDAFVNKGAMSSNMKRITIKLIIQDRVGLFGAVSYARLLYFKGG